MPPKIKTLLAAVVLGGFLGAQAPLWAWGIRTGFTFEDSSEEAPSVSPAVPSPKWLAKTKIAPLWLPRLAVFTRVAAGLTSLIFVYALTVLAALRAFRFQDRNGAASAASGGVLISLFAALRFSQSGVSPPPLLAAAGIAAALLGAGVGYRLNSRPRGRIPTVAGPS